MNWFRSLIGLGGKAWGAISGAGGEAASIGTGLWRMVRQTGQGLTDIITHPLTNAMNAVANVLTAASGDGIAFLRALLRVEPHVNLTMIRPLRLQFGRQLAALRARISYLIGLVYAYVNARITATRHYAWSLVHHERIARRRADRRQEAFTRRHVRWSLALVQREAASGYALTNHQRLGIIGTLADAIVNRNPVVRDIVGRLVQGATDLAEIDDPVLRIALGFIVKELIKRLGVDKAMGVMLDDLLGPLVGQARPRNLHDVIEAIGTRLDALEGQWVTFYKDGGAQILQAGQEWKGITGLTADLGMALFLGLMVADPAGWAAEVADVVGPVVGGAVDAVNGAMREWR